MSTVMDLRDENATLRAALSEREARVVEYERRIGELERHVARIAELERQIELLSKELREATSDKAKLEARLKELLRARRALDETAAGQLVLAFQSEAPLLPAPCVKEAPDGETPTDRLRPRHVRKHAPRKLAYEALPREHVHHELAANERVCGTTGKELVQIGEKTSERLEYRPAKFVVIVHHCAVYGLNETDRQERTIEPIAAPEPVRPIEGANAGPGLIAQILVQKYRDHLPLYRQQAIFERAGLAIPRQTLCDWVMAAAFNLEPIQRNIRKRIVESGVVQLDDTPVDCQGEHGGPNFQARLWTYASPLVECVAFDFALDRKHEHVLDVLGPDFTGFLLGDGYTGYGTIAKKRPGVIEAGCWAHALRKCRDAIRESPVEASALTAAARSLFDIEAEAVNQRLGAEAVKALRLEKSRPVLERIRERCERYLATGPSEEGELTVAVKYVMNQWEALNTFLLDGRVPIHNNTCERAIRPVALGRKNWLFAGSERGGEAAAIVYTLTESCVRAEVDSFSYLSDVLVRVATHPADRVGELAPDRWKALFGNARRG